MLWLKAEHHIMHVKKMLDFSKSPNHSVKTIKLIPFELTFSQCLAPSFANENAVSSK